MVSDVVEAVSKVGRARVEASDAPGNRHTPAPVNSHDGRAGNHQAHFHAPARRGFRSLPTAYARIYRHPHAELPHHQRRQRERERTDSDASSTVCDSDSYGSSSTVVESASEDEAAGYEAEYTRKADKKFILRPVLSYAGPRGVRRSRQLTRPPVHRLCTGASRCTSASQCGRRSARSVRCHTSMPRRCFGGPLQTTGDLACLCKDMVVSLPSTGLFLNRMRRAATKGAGSECAFADDRREVVLAPAAVANILEPVETCLRADASCVSYTRGRHCSARGSEGHHPLNL